MKIQFKPIYLYISKNLEKGFIIFPIPGITSKGVKRMNSAYNGEKYREFTKKL